MIVVVGSAHDRVAASLVKAWPSAGLLSAEDLTSPGWVWGSDDDARQWIVNGRTVNDTQITGVFVRRSTVYPEELLSTHPQDRSYLASEIQAFLVAVLASTKALVVNPVRNGSLGEETLRPEIWGRFAVNAGLSLRPFKLSSKPGRERPLKLKSVDVVGDQALGDLPEQYRTRSKTLVQQLGLYWARCVFDGNYRLLTVTTATEPGDHSLDALGKLLSGNVS